MDLIERFPRADQQSLQRILDEKRAWISQKKKGFLRYRQPYLSVRDLRASICDFSLDTVRIGRQEDVELDQLYLVEKVLRSFMPWRKGPFSVFDISIDAEWRSERKWNRILPQLPELRGKTVADIGCNNGYYMFRMVAHQPEFVLGFEPYVQHYYAFQTLNSFAGCQTLQVEPLGIEHLALFPNCFDVIFCMGILYHRASPLHALGDVLTALKPGGWLILESQIIPGDDSVALFPEQTYAKVPGTWFVPTVSCLRNWLKRAGFGNVQLFCDHPMSSLEQRRTEWMTFESYEEFIDKDDPTRTIEGYPAPRRAFYKAQK